MVDITKIYSDRVPRASRGVSLGFSRLPPEHTRDWKDNHLRTTRDALIRDRETVYVEASKEWLEANRVAAEKMTARLVTQAELDQLNGRKT